MVGEEWSAVGGDAGNDVWVVEAHETKGRGETFLVIRFAVVPLGRGIVGYALRDSGGVIKGMIG